MGPFKLIALAIPLHAYYLLFSIVQDFYYIYFLKSLISEVVERWRKQRTKRHIISQFPGGRQAGDWQDNNDFSKWSK